jgi:sulfite reductase (NADPH) flavoprotein alpha-component
VIAAIGAEPDFPIVDRPLRQVLISDMSLGAVPDALFHLISYLTGGDRRNKAKALAASADPDGDAATLDVLAAVEKFRGIRPDPEAFVEALEPLLPRLYSIASSPKVDAGRISLTVDAVRYPIGDRTRLGVASTLLGERIPAGANIKAFIQRAADFALPQDGARPIIMIGPGTGVAPFRAFLRERHAVGAAGKSWLFFGHRCREHNFFYEEEFAQMRKAGTLTRLDLAFSRDQAEKVYVQHRMRENAAELWSWLDAGAHVYVCGDAKRMARDVDQDLQSIVAEHGGMAPPAAKAYVTGLAKEGRYQRDVY